MTKQLTPEELVELQNAVSKYENTSFMIGQYTIEIESLKAARRIQVESATEALNRRDELVAQYEAKYGTGQVNIQTGEITED